MLQWRKLQLAKPIAELYIKARMYRLHVEATGDFYFVLAVKVENAPDEPLLKLAASVSAPSPSSKDDEVKKLKITLEEF